MNLPDLLALFIAIYAIIGVVFGLYFVFVRAHVIDPAAKGGGIFFKILIFFGSAALWPALISMAFGEAKNPIEVTAHRRSSTND